MEEPTKFFTILQDLLKKILETLAGVGIELPAIVVQVFLLVLVLALIYLLLPKPKEWREKPLVTMGVVALALVAGGIFFTWIRQASIEFPDQVRGSIIIDAGASMSNYQNMHVELRDEKGHKMSTGTAYVDSENQSVFLYYSPEIGNLPKKILVNAPSCDPSVHEYAIEFKELVSGEFTRHVNCKES